MPRPTAERVAAIVARVAHLNAGERLDVSTPLIGGGIALDSVSVLELLVTLEQEFNVEVNADDLLQAEALQTVGTLAAFIDARTQGA